MQKKSVARFKQGAVALPERLKMLWSLSGQMTERDSSPRSSSPTARGTASPSMSGSESRPTLDGQDETPSSSSSSPWTVFDSSSPGVERQPVYPELRFLSERDGHAHYHVAPSAYSEGFNQWAESLSAETGLPVDRVVKMARGEMTPDLSDDPPVDPEAEDEWLDPEEVKKRIYAYAKESETRQHEADREITIRVGDLDGLIDSFLNTRGCTLWGEQWTITYPDTRAKAHAFIRKTILTVVSPEEQ